MNREELKKDFDFKTGLADERIPQLEELGFIADLTTIASNAGIQYTNGERRIPATLILGCGYKEWAQLIEKLKQ